MALKANSESLLGHANYKIFNLCIEIIWNIYDAPNRMIWIQSACL